MKATPWLAIPRMSRIRRAEAQAIRKKKTKRPSRYNKARPFFPNTTSSFGAAASGGNLGVILVRVCEPVFQNLPHSYTWPSKKRTHSYT